MGESAELKPVASESEAEQGADCTPRVGAVQWVCEQTTKRSQGVAKKMLAGAGVASRTAPRPRRSWVVSAGRAGAVPCRPRDRPLQTTGPAQRAGGGTRGHRGFLFQPDPNTPAPAARAGGR